MSTISLKANLRDPDMTICRRETERRRFNLVTPGYLTLEDGTEQTVHLADISVKGVGFYFTQPLERGAMLDLELWGDSAEPVVAKAKVAHATQGLRDLWLIGCEFLIRLKPEVLKDLLEPAATRA